MIQELATTIAEHWATLSGILLVVLTGYLLTISVLKMISNTQFTRSEYLSLGLAGWLLPASLLAWLAFFFGRLGIGSRLVLIPLFIPCIISIIYLVRLHPDPKPDQRPIDFFLPLFLIFTIPLRLIFINDLPLPLYFDSVQHYATIQHILNSQSANPFLSQTYYHIGYHILSAFIITAFHAPIGATMLVLGQCLLAIMPMAVFFLLRYITKSDMAGMFAVGLAAFGWYMPAHAVNWGKYPALTSLGLIPFVISLAYLQQQRRELKPVVRHLFTGFLLASIIVSTLIHSRSLIIYGLTFAAWLIADWIEKFPVRQKHISLFLILSGIAIETFVTKGQPLLAILYDPYLNAGIVITSLVVFLALFARRVHPQLTTTCLLTIAFLCGSIFVPVKGVGGYPDLTLLDRPIVEMVLYLPLTILGGLGLAGLQTLNLNRYTFNKWIGFALMAVVIIHAARVYKFQPSECCMIIGNDDVAAMAWMNIHIPNDAQVGVAATAMDVLISESFEGFSGSDAGVWITPLINRATIPLFNNTSFDQQSVLDSICAAGIQYLYVGEKGTTFNRDVLNLRPEWYTVQLFMPAVQIYEVTGCNH